MSALAQTWRGPQGLDSVTFRARHGSHAANARFRGKARRCVVRRFLVFSTSTTGLCGAVEGLGLESNVRVACGDADASIVALIARTLGRSAECNSELPSPLATCSTSQRQAIRTNTERWLMPVREST
jgi:hypothetical protein